MLFPRHFPTRFRDLTEVLHDAGQFYWGSPQAWTQHRPALRADSALVRIPIWWVQDIDTEGDWRRAEKLAPLVREHLALERDHE